MTDNSLMTDEYIKNMRLLSWILFSELKDVKLSTYEYDLWELLDIDKDTKNDYTFDSDKKYIEDENNEIIKGYQKNYIEINGKLYHKKGTSGLYDLWELLDKDTKNDYTFDLNKKYIIDENNKVIKEHPKDYIKINNKLYHKKGTSKYGFFKYKIIRNIQDFNNFKFRQDAIYYFNNFYLKINENKETLETEDGDIDIDKKNLLNEKGYNDNSNNYLYRKDPDPDNDKSYRYLYNKNKKDDLISYYIDYSNLKDYDIIIDMINSFSMYNINGDRETLKKFVSKNLKNDKIDFNEKANDKYLGKPLFKNSLYIMDIIAILSTILLMFFIYFIKEDYNTNIYIVSGILIIIAIIYVFFSILLYN